MCFFGLFICLSCWIWCKNWILFNSFLLLNRFGKLLFEFFLIIECKTKLFWGFWLKRETHFVELVVNQQSDWSYTTSVTSVAKAFWRNTKKGELFSWRKPLMMGLSCLSLLGQKGSPGKWRKQPTVYREHVRPICHPLKVDLFQCYYVHYASCGSVQQYNDQVYILSLWVGGVTVWGAGLGAALLWSYSGEACSDSCIY